MIDLNKPVQLRNGHKAEVWKIADGFIWGRLHSGGGWVPHHWLLSGLWLKDEESPFDLINVPEVKEFVSWMNVYKIGGVIHVEHHANKQLAQGLVGVDAIAVAVPLRVSIDGYKVTMSCYSSQ